MGMTICQKLQESPAPAAVALGCFDGLHMGHQRVISGAINADGLLPTVFTFDASPQADICGKGASFLGTTLIGITSQLTGSVNRGIAVLIVTFLIGLFLFMKAASMKESAGQ